MFLAMPAAPTAPTTRSDFEILLNNAFSLRGSKQHALDRGITHEALIRYADGAVFDDEERRFLESVISRNDWSRNVVVERVKSKRKKLRSAA